MDKQAEKDPRPSDTATAQRFVALTDEERNKLLENSESVTLFKGKHLTYFKFNT